MNAVPSNAALPDYRPPSAPYKLPARTATCAHPNTSNRFNVIKYGQKDAANEILRTEVLSKLEQNEPVSIVTYPEALAEKVVSRQTLNQQTLTLATGKQYETEAITKKLTDYGFEHVDYVYEPGQFAMRGSILDVYSFASEYPYRIDFFGDEIDSIRTFEVETQLSKERKTPSALCLS